MRKQRNSNFELVRIAAMFFIILHHLMVHCINVQLNQSVLFNSPPVFYKRLLLLNFFILSGKLGNSLFILISGYFLAGNTRTDITRSIKKILLQIAFASCVLTFASFAYQYFVRQDVTDLIDINIFNNSWWFAGYYILILMVGVLFLNRYLSGCTQKQYLTLIAILFASCSMGWIGTFLHGISEGVRILVAGVFLYALGGYIRKYNPFDRVRTWAVIMFIFLLCGLVIVTGYNDMISHINDYIRNPQEPFHQGFSAYYDYGIMVLLFGISLFELGRRIRIKPNRVINYIGASTFMVYLMHENTLMRRVWRKFDWNAAYYYHPGLFFERMAFWVVAVFVVGVASYAVFELTEKMLLSKPFKKLIFKE